jgi:sulfur carrier protein
MSRGGMVDIKSEEEEIISVNNRKVEWEENMTVARLLEIMNYTFKMLVVKIDGQLVKRKDYEKVIIPKKAEVKIIHLIAGG